MMWPLHCHGGGEHSAGQGDLVHGGEGIPRIVLDLPGMAVLFKPPGWEVDDEDVRPNGKWLSRFLQATYPRSAVARDQAHAFGMVHRLDVPSSGLILTGTSYEGHYDLKWQIDTLKVVR